MFDNSLDSLKGETYYDVTKKKKSSLKELPGLELSMALIFFPPSLSLGRFLLNAGISWMQELVMENALLYTTIVVLERNYMGKITP